VSSFVEDRFKILTDNRHAGHHYHLMERFEAGLVLTGTEVKSARAGKIQLKDSYAEVLGNEAWLVNAHISHYSHGNLQNHDPARRRKLLLHRQEIDKLHGKTREKGLTLVPTKVYLRRGTSSASWPWHAENNFTTNAKPKESASRRPKPAPPCNAKRTRSSNQNTDPPINP